MIRRKLLLTLLLVIIPCLVTTQTTNGQTFTNSTVRMVTSLATSTQLRSEPIFPIPPQLGKITIPPTHGVCGVYFVQAFNATAGTIVSGSMTADNAVDLYLMTDAGFQTWSNQILGGGTCTPASLVLSKQSTTSYNFTITVPSNGQYELVLNNLSTATVTANLSISKSASPALVTITKYSTLTQSSTQTMIPTSTGQAAAPDQSNWVWAVLIIIAILAVIIYLATKRKHNDTTKSKNA